MGAGPVTPPESNGPVQWRALTIRDLKELRGNEMRHPHHRAPCPQAPRRLIGTIATVPGATTPTSAIVPPDGSRSSHRPHERVVDPRGLPQPASSGPRIGSGQPWVCQPAGGGERLGY
jgi:hypothetical protein